MRSWSLIILMAIRLKRQVKNDSYSNANGRFKVWTKRFGTNPKIKILLLHGGQQ
jgi:hypothetical protein